MRDPEITIVYNEPFPCGIPEGGEFKAEMGVLKCVNAVHEALLDCGYIVYLLPVVPPLESVRQQLSKVKTGIVFNLFEGFFDFPQSESIFAGILDEMKFKYTGCPAGALSVSLDKASSKTLLAQNGVAVPDFQVLNPYNTEYFELNFPCIVKPRCQDASHGIIPDSVVNTVEEMNNQVKRICEQFEDQAIVEEFIDGREFNITVMGDKELVVLPSSEIVYELPSDVPRILTYEAKWVTESEYYKKTNVACPAKVRSSLNDEISNIAITAYSAFGCSGYARVDMRLDTNSKQLKVLEVNPNPDISSDSGAARQAYYAGIVYSQFIERIVDYAVKGVHA